MIIAICFFDRLYSQSFKLIGQVLNQDADLIKISSNFYNFTESEIELFLSKQFIIENWEPLPDPHTPKIEPFLQNFDWDHKWSVNEDETIDFSKLPNNFKKAGNDKNYFILGNPMFNQDNTWAVMYQGYVFDKEVGKSTHLYICRWLLAILS
ncbi:MAG: hypothetical protein WBG71_15250 [Leeuwenhoekiella sp.]